MSTKKKNLALSILAMVGAAATAFTAATGTNPSQALAGWSAQTNEYGCRGNCTGEYAIGHVKSLLIGNPSLNGTPNIRIKAVYIGESGGAKWFRDPGFECKKSDIGLNAGSLAAFVPEFSDPEKGKPYSPGDAVQISASVSWERVGAKTVRLSKMTVYGVNGKVDHSIIPPVSYLTEQ